MILLGSRLKKMPVMGLQTGTELATLTEPIVDPGTLQIHAYAVDGPLLDEKPAYLRLEDVRELSDIGMIIDSNDEFVVKGDVVKLDELIRLGFHLVGMHVHDETLKNIGTVIDYSVETTTFTIQQLTVKRPLMHRFKDTELLIHRSQIIEINDSAIVISSQAKIAEPTVADVGGSFVNPFRSKPDPAPQAITTNES